jgi:hypothetical protein
MVENIDVSLSVLTRLIRRLTDFPLVPNQLAVLFACDFCYVKVV